MSHLTQDELDTFLIGAPASDPARIRRHLAECETCARRLAAAARFEMRLEHATARLPAGRRVARPRYALAAAAAIFVLVGGGIAVRMVTRPNEFAPAPRSVDTLAPGHAGIASVAEPAAPMPRLCEDALSPADLCLRPADTNAGATSLGNAAEAGYSTQ